MPEQTQTLEERLRSKLPIHLYGVDKANTFESLLKEIETGDCELFWEGDEPVRSISVVLIDITCGDKRLMEDRQVFHDGRERKREIDGKPFKGISEKILPNESALLAARRALREELGFSMSQVAEITFKFLSIHEEWRESVAYPGLDTSYTLVKSTVELPTHLYKDEYVEVAEDKRTFFNWINK